jgi:hypothetical protein
MPGYGVEGPRPNDAPSWETIEKRLEDARSYWLVTSSLDGRPHAAPVWGAWLDDVLVFDSSPSSRKTRNLQANPRAIAHLEAAAAVVSLEGPVEPIGDRAVLERFADAYNAKYDGFTFDPDNPPGAVFVLAPDAVFTWSENLKDATRWTFRPRRKS